MRLIDMLTNRTEMPTLKSSMDAFALRQKTISNNIANAQTPGYIRREVSFEDEFKDALRSSKTALTKTDDAHIPHKYQPLNVPSKVVLDRTPFDNGINNVDMEKEMADLAKTQIDFDAMTKLAKKHLTLLRGAIRGSGV